MVAGVFLFQRVRAFRKFSKSDSRTLYARRESRMCGTSPLRQRAQNALFDRPKWAAASAQVNKADLPVFAWFVFVFMGWEKCQLAFDTFPAVQLVC